MGENPILSIFVDEILVWSGGQISCAGFGVTEEILINGCGVFDVPLDTIPPSLGLDDNCSSKESSFFSMISSSIGRYASSRHNS